MTAHYEDGFPHIVSELRVPVELAKEAADEIERLRDLLWSIRTDLETGRKLRPTVEQALVDALEPPIGIKL